MNGENNLAKLLKQMTPKLYDIEYGFGLVPAGQALRADLVPFAIIEEEEGKTVIAPVDALATHGIDHVPGWARISLEVHSDLNAVGLTAAISAALTTEEISANVVAGYFHDHFFVQWDRRHDAMAILLAYDKSQPLAPKL